MAVSRVVHHAGGRALVAARALPAGTTVARFEGRILSYTDVPADEIRYALWIGPDRWLIPETSARFVNHSCDPNCDVVFDHDDDLVLVTRRAVAAGDELTFDYAVADDPRDEFWDERWTFECRCGAPACRGVIDRYVRRGEAA